MKRDTLEKALNEISDSHIEEAAEPKKRHTVRWLGAVAAVLAVVLLFHTFRPAAVIHAKAVSTPSASRAPDQYDTDYMNARFDSVETALTQGSDFFTSSSQTFLTTKGDENRVWSPVNGYISLAMLAETTGGNTQKQILDTLGADSLDALRSQVSAMWESVYTDDGKEICTLANSLWLDDSISYHQEAMDQLAYHHYASVYQGDLSSKKATDDLQNWLNQQTGGHLKKSADTLALPPQTLLALASTVHLKSQWADDFSASNNKRATFHAPEGDISCTFMNKKEYQAWYSWGDSFGAVSLLLKNGCRMWFILPDEGKAPDDVLKEGQYLEIITKETHDEKEENSKYMKVNLSIPKFDVNSSCNLKEGLQQLGITDAFDPQAADFSTAISSQVPVWVESAQQAARVTIDEDGVTASSYIVIPGAGAMPPPDEVIDFILDKPFLFAITKKNIPLFTGVVNHP